MTTMDAVEAMKRLAETHVEKRYLRESLLAARAQIRVALEEWRTPEPDAVTDDILEIVLDAAGVGED